MLVACVPAPRAPIDQSAACGVRPALRAGYLHGSVSGPETPNTSVHPPKLPDDKLGQPVATQKSFDPSVGRKRQAGDSKRRSWDGAYEPQIKQPFEPKWVPSGAPAGAPGHAGRSSPQRKSADRGKLRTSQGWDDSGGAEMFQQYAAAAAAEEEDDVMGQSDGVDDHCSVPKKMRSMTEDEKLSRSEPLSLASQKTPRSGPSKKKDADMGKEDRAADFHSGPYQPSMADLEDLNRSGALSVPNQPLPAPSDSQAAPQEDAEEAEDDFSDISSDSDLWHVQVWPEEVTM